MACRPRWELLGYFSGATAANSTHQNLHPWSLLCNPVMTGGTNGVLMKATPVWPSSSSTLPFLNSLLQQPNCEIELFSPPCALSRTAAHFQPQYEHREAALTTPIIAALPVFLPHQSIGEGGVCSAGRGPRLPAGVCWAHTGRRRRQDEEKKVAVGRKVNFKIKACNATFRLETIYFHERYWRN